MADLANLVPRGRSLLIGVLGAHDSGKTTLLAGNYLQILKGSLLADAHFSGSRTLGAWESLAAWIRFDEATRSPSFPPHTPRGTSRVPGLLHLALRNSKNEFRDVLFTDAPGEWFTRWSIQEDAPEAAGARWVARHADAFLLLADCVRLNGSERGQARNSVRQLIERLGNHANKRPTVFVWAKSDHKIPEAIQSTLRETLKRNIPHATEIESNTQCADTLVSALDSAIRAVWYPPFAGPVAEPVIEYNPFAAFRGFNENS
jgi:hypothetical protein